ncbi:MULTISPECIES: DUF309 domain-containing protein [Brevibacillus]|uniref:DUF309 domain-containing protein n=1 Tax=Brevibacillus invocatus TaxID=173959 RepID=A0A3M8CGP0_9BACL|nr:MULTISPECIES: DUF309 domain-containing protein [Brevibacillus]MCM3080833.1 DUF309 domain-containing protein [Brevibacillus invocatus]MCM3431020.1 DUF309 domain-containing protein [Brevibacillus invocatus]MDH4618501.1 DUF309 domain-containing protein [Brevibacillus sp. AY1]RNB74663.1 DUF309 domain-containing protein [Brevibacillus invocatus]
MHFPEQYLQFIDKFNAGEYYECHDLLEEIWMEDKSDKFLQGLLQLSVGLYHLEYGNIKGARWMLGNARKYLLRYSPNHWGLDVHDVITYIQTCEATLPDVEVIPYAQAKAISYPTYRLRLDTS